MAANIASAPSLKMSRETLTACRVVGHLRVYFALDAPAAVFHAEHLERVTAGLSKKRDSIYKRSVARMYKS